MKRLIVPISFAVMALAIAAMLPALVSAQTTSNLADSCYTFSRNLSVTSSGAEVARLSSVLVRQGFLSVQTVYFSEDVAAAVARFQAKYGLPTTGFVGPLTLAQLNSLYQCGPASIVMHAPCPFAGGCTSALGLPTVYQVDKNSSSNSDTKTGYKTNIVSVSRGLDPSADELRQALIHDISFATPKWSEKILLT